jgi:hypothetical protein
VLVELNGGEPPKAGGGTKEIWQVFKLLEEQGRALRTVVPHRIIYNRNRSSDAPTAVVTSLSPSDEGIRLSIESMIAFTPTSRSQRTALPWRDPNHNSIVLWVKVGGVRMLLGADLEEVSPKSGWTAIVADPLRDEKPAEVFKVPHHGSMTSCVPAVWEELLIDRPCAVVTPFRQGSVRLPTSEGIQFICERTDLASTTHLEAGNPPPVRREPTVEKTIKEANIRLRQRAFRFGQVRLRRRDMSTQAGDWEVSRFGAAGQLCT